MWQPGQGDRHPTSPPHISQLTLSPLGQALGSDTFSCLVRQVHLPSLGMLRKGHPSIRSPGSN